MTKYKLFKIGDLFDIHPTKAYKLTNEYLFSNTGNTPVLSNSSTNNGIGGYSNLLPTEDGGIITFSDTTMGANTMFFQSSPFIGYPHVQGMYPYDVDKWDEKTSLYLISALQKACGKGFNYANKFNRKIVLSVNVMLPVKTENGEYVFDDSKKYHPDGYIPDFDYMKEWIAKLEQERISELEHLLIAAGSDGYELTSEDKMILAGNNKHTKTFCVSDLFCVKTPKTKINANSVEVYNYKKGHPYVVRTSQNNGIRGYIEFDEKYLNEANTISFGQDTATMFYQEQPYFTGDKIKIFAPKIIKLTAGTANYLIACMKNAFSMFSWGQSKFEVSVIESVSFELPIVIDQNNVPVIGSYVQIS